MTDKVQKIREEVEKLKSQLLRGACSSQIAMETRCKEEAYNEVLAILDTMQEGQKEPVSEELNTESMIESYKQRLISQANGVKNSPLIDMCLASYKHGINETLDTLNLSNAQRTVKNWKEPVSEELEKAANEWDAKASFTPFYMVLDDNNNPNGVRQDYITHAESFKAGAKWQKEKDEFITEDLEEEIDNYVKRNGYDGLDSIEEIKYIAQYFTKWQKTKDDSCTSDLGDYINELSKQFPEVSFAKLSRIAVRVVKWQNNHLWKPADGDDLPEIDREVIALAQPYPNDEHLRVVFAHRPNKYAKVWNSDLGEEQVVEIERHGKGGWNIPNIVCWLDVELPKEIEL